MNALVQSKADTKRLELNDTKCFKMHVGGNKTLCPQLRIHNQKMLNTEQEKYLGDIVTSDAKIDKNIKMRQDKGIGISNQIMSILKEVSFGMFHFEMGLLFRSSLLVNGILFNTEAIHNITDKHVTQLEECDKSFMRQLFDAEIGTPVESFYIETSTLPIRHILMGRRIMYYHTLLRKSESELARRVFNAQVNFPSKSDWVSQARKDLLDCEINLTDSEIAMKSSYQFKSLVRKKIKQKSIDYLTDQQMRHSKSQFLHQNESMKEYLKTDTLSTKQKQMLFKMRSRMCPNKTNFSNKYGGKLECSLCQDKNSKESEIHLLSCPFLVHHPKLAEELKTVKYEDIYKDLPRQIAAAKLWMNIFKIYDDENTSK